MSGKYSMRSIAVALDKLKRDAAQSKRRTGRGVDMWENGNPMSYFPSETRPVGVTQDAGSGDYFAEVHATQLLNLPDTTAGELWGVGLLPMYSKVRARYASIQYTSTECAVTGRLYRLSSAPTPPPPVLGVASFFVDTSPRWEAITPAVTAKQDLEGVLTNWSRVVFDFGREFLLDPERSIYCLGFSTTATDGVISCVTGEPRCFRPLYRPGTGLTSEPCPAEFSGGTAFPDDPGLPHVQLLSERGLSVMTF